MKRLWKRILCVLTALCMTGGLFIRDFDKWLVVQAADNSGSCGASVYWNYNSDTKTLSITGSGGMYNYKSLSDQPWKSFIKEIKQLKLDNGITHIGNNAFSGCTGLTSITIPDSVTSIESDAFHGCTGLTSITIPNSVTSIGGYTFDGCTGLTKITIPNSVTSIGGYTFDGCTSLTSITIPNSVTSIGSSAFRGCTGLTSITIPDSVTSLGGFDECTGLTSITIPHSVTSIGYRTFFGCTGLTSITIPDSVTSIGQIAFTNCTRLESIIIPDSVTSIGENAFRGCEALTIKGYSSSYADQYARLWGIKYESLGYKASDEATTTSTSTPIIAEKNLVRGMLQGGQTWVLDDAGLFVARAYGCRQKNSDREWNNKHW